MALASVFSICGLGQKFCINIFMILFYFSYQHPVCLKKKILWFLYSFSPLKISKHFICLFLIFFMVEGQDSVFNLCITST